MLNQRNFEKYKAILIGFVCIVTYLTSYYVRNILSVLTPYMISSGAFVKEYLVLLSSTYMIVYAAGQLLMGIIGDYIKPKYITVLGLTFTAIALIGFAVLQGGVGGIICFGIVGFGLSTLRGPLVKVISENSLPKYARVSCTLLSFAAFAGPLFAGLAAMVMQWKAVFVFSGILTAGMAVFIFLMLTIFEKRGLVSDVAVTPKNNEKRYKVNVFEIFKVKNFIVYMVCGMIVEIAAASINFWMPTYFNQYLMLSEATSNMLFSAISFLRALCPFMALYLFKLARENDIIIVRTAFGMATIFFWIIIFVHSAVINVILFTLALMCSSIASAIMWCTYIPSLAKTGRVSSANGILDCTGYIAASTANVVVVPIVNNLGWSGVVASWGVIMLAGAVVMMFGKKSWDLTEIK